MEFTATEHAALMRVRFPNGMTAQNEGNVLRRVLIILNDATVDTIGNGSKAIWGSTRANSGGVRAHVDEQGNVTQLLNHFLFAQFMPQPTAIRLVSNNQSKKIYGYAEFAPDVTEVTVAVATSLFSLDQARANFEHELLVEGSVIGFDELAAAGKEAWCRTLQRVEVWSRRYFE